MRTREAPIANRAVASASNGAAPTMAGARTRRTPGPSAAADLAGEMDRVLKISQPRAPIRSAGPSVARGTAGADPTKASTFRKTTTATASRTAATRTTTSSGARTQTSRPVPAENPAPPVRRPAASGSRSATATKAATKEIQEIKGRVRSAQQPASRTGAAASQTQPILPLPSWMDLAVTMSSVDRATQAMKAINTAHQDLGSALRAGFKTGATITDKSEWTQARIDQSLDVSGHAIRVLRDLDDRRKLGQKGVEVEKAALSRVHKCLVFDMYEAAKQNLVPCQPRLLKRLRLPDVSVEGLDLWGSLVSRGGEVEVDNEQDKSLLIQAILYGWLCAAATENLSSQLMPLPPLDGSSSISTTLHPFHLSFSVPIGTAASPLIAFHREFLRTPLYKEAWRHTCLLALQALAAVVTTRAELADSIPYTPSTLWERTSVHMSNRVKSVQDTAAYADAEAVVRGVVVWAEYVVGVKGESKTDWFGGQGWVTLMDLWISLGKKLGDPKIVDDALSRMMTTATVRGSAPSPISDGSSGQVSTPDQSSKTEAQRKNDVKLKSRKAVCTAETVQIGGRISGLIVVMQKHSSSPTDLTGPAVVAAIRTLEMPEYADAISSLLASDNQSEAALKSCTNIEQARRGAKKVLLTLHKNEQEGKDAGDGCGLGLAALEWLLAAVDLSEDCMQSCFSDEGDAQEAVKILCKGSIDTLIFLSQPSLSSSKSSGISISTSAVKAYLERAARLADLAQGLVTPSEALEVARAITSSAYARAVMLWKQAKHKEVLPFAKVAMNVSLSTLQRIGQSEDDADEKMVKRLHEVEEGIGKPAELYGVCCLHLNDFRGMLEGYGLAIRLLPRAKLDSMLALVHARSAADVIASSTEISSQIDRLCRFISGDAAGILPHLDEALLSAATLSERHMPVYAIMLEHMGGILVENHEKVEVAHVAVRCMHRAAEIVADLPVLRTRIVMRHIRMIADSGACPSDLPKLFELAESCIDFMASSTDKDRARKHELSAGLILLRTISAYQTALDPKVEVAQLAAKGMHELRSMLIPPTPTPATSKQIVPTTIKRAVPGARVKQPLGRAATTAAVTPARGRRQVSENKGVPTTKSGKMSRQVSETAIGSPARAISGGATNQWHDLPVLLDLILALIALLDLMGLRMQRVEALKLARAMLRETALHTATVNTAILGMRSTYLRISGMLGSEYISLGKWTRARTVLEHALKVAQDNEGEIMRMIEVNVGLRWCVLLVKTGRVDDAKTEYDRLGQLAKSFETVTQGSFRARLESRCEMYERNALARYAAAAIKEAEGDTASAITHIQCAHRLACRQLDAIAKLAPEVSVGGQSSTITIPGAGSLSASAATRPKVPQAADDPFTAPAALASPNTSETAPNTGADEPSKDESQSLKSPFIIYISNRHLSSRQWSATSFLLDSCFVLSEAFATRGSVSHVEYYLPHAAKMALHVKSSVLAGRAEQRLAALNVRLRKFDESEKKLDVAGEGLAGVDGPDSIECTVVAGDLLRKKEATEDAIQAFEQGGVELEGIETNFTHTEGLLPTPQKVVKAVQRLSQGKKEHLLPNILAHVLRQRILLSVGDGSKVQPQIRGQGQDAAVEGLMQQMQSMVLGEATPEDLLLQGQVALLEVLNAFKTDLFTSSLSESTIVMPMSSLACRSSQRGSTRSSLHALLARAEAAFSSALSLSYGSARAEDVRSISLSLALLHAFQSSLGCGGPDTTGVAADLLASTSSVTLHRELLELIDSKVTSEPSDDMTWPGLVQRVFDVESDDIPDIEKPFKGYWSSLLPASKVIPSSDPIDLSPLPSNWAVVSVSISDDLTTMFITRHQKDISPVVLCLPFDRQERRDIGEDAQLPFAAARDEMNDIIKTSDDSARNAKNITTSEGRKEWWALRYDLDRRLKELLGMMEEMWLGAFKSIFASQATVTQQKIGTMRTKLEKVFTAALSSAGTDMKRATEVKLDDAILRCLSTLPASTSEDDLEDLVYFVLDVYGFHGVPVAISEMDTDQIVVDLKTLLTELEVSRPSSAANASSRAPPKTPNTPATSKSRRTGTTKATAPPAAAATPASNSSAAQEEGKAEHLFLILDKHTSAFPWESIPSLRGRSVSRVPSLPFLLDHLRLAKLSSCTNKPQRPVSLLRPIGQEQPSRSESGASDRITGGELLMSASATASASESTTVSASTSPPSDRSTSPSSGLEDAKTALGVNARKVFYILNPSGDLQGTQTHFEPWLASMRESAGWKGIQGRALTELGMLAALKEYDLVLYFGHGGAEQYIRSYKLKSLHRCATTMLWGCSSGSLKDQGDLDRAGTAWHYMMAGCPSLVANLWDVTDRDIDRLSEHVCKSLLLDANHLSPPSTTAASSSTRSDPAAAVPILPLSDVSITDAVNGAREECRLKYLTGAAPVVYGLPMWMY